MRFVVKYGPGTKIREGNNLIFVPQHLSPLAIPRLWAVYEEDGDVFIIMECFDGDTLRDIWPSLQAPDKSAITKQLRSIMDQLRALRPPESPFYGSFERGPVPYFLFCAMESNPTINGSLVIERDFIQGLVRNLRTIDELNNQDSYKTDFYEQNLPSCFRPGRPTLTHGDIQRQNIMVRRTCPRGDRCEPVPRLVIIDREDSGW